MSISSCGLLRGESSLICGLSLISASSRSLLTSRSLLIKRLTLKIGLSGLWFKGGLSSRLPSLNGSSSGGGLLWIASSKSEPWSARLGLQDGGHGCISASSASLCTG